MSNFNNNRIWFLHALRGIASILVVIQHLVVMFWYSNQAVVSSFVYLAPKLNISDLFYFKAIKFYTHFGFDLGDFGVAIFFLISGFVIPFTLMKNRGVKFWISRLLRIYPTYIIGFSITFLSIFIYSLSRGITFSFSIKNYLAQILLIRDWLWFPSIDGVSWTLETELKFYLLIWIIAMLGKLNNSKAIIITALSLGMINLVLHNQYVNFFITNSRIYQLIYISTYSAISMVFMLLGVCFYNYYQKNWSTNKFLFTILIVYFSFIVAFLNGPDANAIKVYSMNYTLALLVFIISYQVQNSLKPNAVLSFLGDISYPLYVIHGVNGYILLTVFDYQKFPPYISIVITIAITFLIAILLHYLIEKPSINAGKRLAKKYEAFQSLRDNKKKF